MFRGTDRLCVTFGIKVRRSAEVKLIFRRARSLLIRSGFRKFCLTAKLTHPVVTTPRLHRADPLWRRPIAVEGGGSFNC